MKKIWITGASSGIGKELAIKFSTNGWKVAASARRENLLKELNTINKNIVPFPFDITSNTDTHDVFKKILSSFKDLDVCIFNSGIFLRNNDSIVAQDVKKIFETNFFGTLNCIEAVSEYFKSRKNGHISIVGSTAGYRGLTSISGYGASKAALINLTESLFLFMQKYNVKVTLINPGFVKTPITDQFDFKMPFIITASDAANKIYSGITKGNKFEISFPKIYVIILKLINILPHKVYFLFVSKKIMYKLLNKFIKK